MIDPALTNVRGRRIIASLVDLALALGLSGLLAWLFAERFEMAARDDAGNPLWSPDNVERLNQIKADGFNRKTEIGDSWYVWSGSTFWLLLVAIAATLFILFVLLPSITDQSVGKMLTNLRVTNAEGGKLGLGGHLVRALASVVDGFPYLLPGLLGWFFAGRSPLNQRWGDRQASSVVTDAKLPMRLIDGDAWARYDEGARQSTGTLDDSMVDVTARLSPDDQEAIDEIEEIEEIEDEPQPEPEAEQVPPPRHRSERTNWEQPRATSAPVWTAQPEAATEEPEEAAADEPEEPTAAFAADNQVEHAGSGSSATDPIWSEQWKAWLYYDAKIGAWLRHDTDANRWMPLD